MQLRKISVVPAPAALAVLLAGCGGTFHSFDAVRSCVDGTAPPSMRITEKRSDMDIIAQRAQLGAIKIDPDGEDVTLIVHRTSTDAQNTEAEYQQFSQAFGKLAG